MVIVRTQSGSCKYKYTLTNTDKNTGYLPVATLQTSSLEHHQQD